MVDFPASANISNSNRVSWANKLRTTKYDIAAYNWQKKNLVSSGMISRVYNFPPV